MIVKVEFTREELKELLDLVYSQHTSLILRLKIGYALIDYDIKKDE